MRGEHAELKGQNEQLLLQLREVAAEARDLLLQGDRPLLTLIAHPTRIVRLAVCHCLWALVLSFPVYLAPLLNVTLNQMRVNHASLTQAAPKAADAAADDLGPCSRLLGPRVPFLPRDAPKEHASGAGEECAAAADHACPADGAPECRGGAVQEGGARDLGTAVRAAGTTTTTRAHHDQHHQAGMVACDL